MVYFGFRLLINETMNNTRKMTNKTLAISVATPAMPLKPNIAAIIAMIKNVKAQFNIDPPKIF